MYEWGGAPTTVEDSSKQ